MENVPQSSRPRIVFSGRRNAGKSSIVNAVTGQSLAVVSPRKGTTTDPVLKSMELAPAGPVLVVDTPGLDDEGSLGQLRVEKAWQELKRASLAVIVADGQEGVSSRERELISRLDENKTPYILVVNKTDLSGFKKFPEEKSVMYTSAKTGSGIEELKQRIAEELSKIPKDKPILGDLIAPGDRVVLVTPIDAGAPKGRIILPQQQTLREILDKGAVALVTQPEALSETLAAFTNPPKLVVTDSQAFGKVSAMVPESLPLTSFSILFARQKGELSLVALGAKALDNIKDGDKILIAEGCTHHRQCDDIGTVKLPSMIRRYTGSQPDFEFCSGYDFPQDLKPFKVVLQCGGCMLAQKEIKMRQQKAEEQSVPFTNYGIAMAYMNGILARSIAMFRELDI